MLNSEKVLIFAQGSGCSKVQKGLNLLEKDVYGRYLQRADLANLQHMYEDTQLERLRLVYCILLQYILAWANSSCLSLHMGNARACTWGKREVVTPTSLFIT